MSGIPAGVNGQLHVIPLTLYTVKRADNSSTSKQVSPSRLLTTFFIVVSSIPCTYTAYKILLANMYIHIRCTSETLSQVSVVPSWTQLGTTDWYGIWNYSPLQTTSNVCEQQTKSQLTEWLDFSYYVIIGGKTGVVLSCNNWPIVLVNH